MPDCLPFQDHEEQRLSCLSYPIGKEFLLLFAIMILCTLYIVRHVGDGGDFIIYVTKQFILFLFNI